MSQPVIPNEMSAAQEAVFEARAERHFRSHPELPNGRNVWAWNREHQPKADRKYKANFDTIFPDAPGAGI